MMASYEKPILEINNGLSEGIYMISGGPDTGSTDENANTAKCDSIYMKGVWQAQNDKNWPEGVTLGYKQQFGCLGCPANTDDGCGLLTHYVASGNASSYDVDDGSRKPSWEKQGYGPDDPVTNFNM